MHKIFLFLTALMVITNSACNFYTECTKTNTPIKFAAHNDKIKETRVFIADALDPAPNSQAPVLPMREAMLKHSGALWLMFNEPQIMQLKQFAFLSGLKKEIESHAGLLSKRTQEEIKAALLKQPDSFFQEWQERLEREINDFTFDAVKDIEHIDLPNLGTAWTTFYRGILTDYFPSLQASDRKNVLASFLRNSSEDSSKTETILSIVSAAGPYFHKFMQLVSDNLRTNNVPDLIELKIALGKLKSELSPIPAFYVEKYKNEIESQNPGIRIEIIKSLGAASVGETFLVKLTNVSEQAQSEPLSRQIVLKLMRPGIEEFAQRERDFFRELAQNISPSMQASILEMEQQILEEMDYTKEFAMLQAGYRHYNDPSIGLHVPKPLHDIKPTKYWMAMELAPGKTLQTMRHQPNPIDNDQAKILLQVQIHAKAILLDALRDKLLMKAFLTEPDGFFHGDLHAGNIMMHFDESILMALSLLDVHHKDQVDEAVVRRLIKLRGVSGATLIQMSIIDFGNAHTLKAKEKFSLLNIIVTGSQIAQSAAPFLQGYNAFLSEELRLIEGSGLYQNLLSDLISKAFQGSKDDNFHQRLGQSIQILMEHNLPVPSKIQAFLRTMRMLERSYEMLRHDAQLLGLDFTRFSLDAGLLTSHTPEALYQKLSSQPENVLKEFIDAMDGDIGTLIFGKLDSIKELEHIAIPNLGKSWSLFFRGILTNYFSSMHLTDRKRVVASLITNSKTASSRTDMILSMVHAGGPFFHKYLQLVSDNLQSGNDPELIELKEGLSKLKSQLPSIGSAEIEHYRRAIEKAHPGLHLEMGRSLGAASVGETFLATLTISNAGKASKPKTIVIKLMRPGIEEIAERDGAFFLSLAKSISPAMEESVKELKRQILDEMDYTKEFEKLELGYKFYHDPEHRLHVPRPLRDITPSKHWMAMELAPGYTFGELRALNNGEINQELQAIQLYAKALLLDVLSDKLIWNAFFLKPEGFFHGDLHAGNIMLSFSDDMIYELRLLGISDYRQITESIVKRLIQTPGIKGVPPVILTVIDFGNAHTLNQSERSALLNVLVSGTQSSQSAAGFLRAYNLLLDQQFKIPEGSPQFNALLLELDQKAFRKPGSGYRLVQHRLGDAIQILMEQDIPVPGILQAFARTIVMLDDSYQWLRHDARLIGLDLERFSLERASQLAIACPLAQKHLLRSADSLLRWKCESADIAINEDNLNAIVEQNTPHLLNNRITKRLLRFAVGLGFTDSAEAA